MMRPRRESNDSVPAVGLFLIFRAAGRSSRTASPISATWRLRTAPRSWMCAIRATCVWSPRSACPPTFTHKVRVTGDYVGQLRAVSRRGRPHERPVGVKLFRHCRSPPSARDRLFSNTGPRGPPLRSSGTVCVFVHHLGSVSAQYLADTGYFESRVAACRRALVAAGADSGGRPRPAAIGCISPSHEGTARTWRAAGRGR